MTSISEIVPKFRRAIGDAETPYSYTDNALTEYIEDSIDQSQLEWSHDYVVDRDAHTVTIDVILAHQMFFVIYSKLEMLKRQPDVSFRSGSLNVTRKSDNKKLLQKKVDEIISNLIMLDGVAVTNTELDQYANRLENWVYIETL